MRSRAWMFVVGLKDYEKRDEREMREKCFNSFMENRK
jgi:hypothetical protein